MSTLENKEEETDPELDNTIAQLVIAEYQVNKLRRILASRLDRSNPIAFSKGSSTYAFESGVEHTESPLKQTRLTLETSQHQLLALLEMR